MGRVEEVGKVVEVGRVVEAGKVVEVDKVVGELLFHLLRSKFELVNVQKLRLSHCK